jgi:serine/threonine protein kinase
MPFVVPIEQAGENFPDYEFVAALTPSEQKAAFQVIDANGRHLCLKIISPDYDIDRLSREIEALQKIDHPNVVRLEEYTYSSKPGKQLHYLVEEFVEGEDLTQHLTERWEVARAGTFFAELCDGLAAMAEVRVVHRDLKPNNIRVRPDGSPVVIDFGLGHLSMPDLTKTEEGAAIGTPLYFAPEQFQGTKRDIDHRTDLFAVGILIYQALVGGHPFATDGITYGELKARVCQSTEYLNQQDFQSLPSQWRLITKRLLAVERAKRPKAASQVADLLRRLGSE